MLYKNEAPFIEHGIPFDRISFSGGRVSADLARHGGLTSIKYYGRQRLNSVQMFEADPISAWKQLFRLFICIDERMYYAEFNDTQIHPWGYESKCTFENVTVEHSLTLLNDALVFEMHVLSAPENVKIGFTLATTENCVKSTGAKREWTSFAIDHERNSMTATVRDDCSAHGSEKLFLTQVNAFGTEKDYIAETFCTVTSSLKMKMKKTPIAFEKDYATVYPVNGKADFVVLFGYDENEFKQRRKNIQTTVAEECEQLHAKYHEIKEVQTRISCSDKTVQSMLNNGRSIIESVKVKDIPGAIRAADSGYWIWGWDSMVFSDAIMLSGGSAFVKDMLGFFRDKAHPELGIFHNMNLAGDPEMSMAPAAQTLYCIMLYNHYVFTGDHAVLAEFYPFARKIIMRALADECGDSGLLKGIALYPDFPEYLDQTGNDISAFNNSISYQAIRCMQTLAAKMAIESDVDYLHGFAIKMKEGFNKYLFDEEKGYYYDSISADDFSPRKHYPVYAILRVTAFADELCEGKNTRLASFMKKNMQTKYGLRMLPRWDSAFMAEGNQLGMYMPVTEGFFRHMMRKTGDQDMMLELIHWCWDKLTLPEALAAEAENNGITLDNPGRKQSFCLNAWYSLFFSAYLGISFEVDRMVIEAPMVRDGVNVEQLQIQGKSLSIEVSVTDCDRFQVYLGDELIGDNIIAYHRLRSSNKITVLLPK